MSDRRLTLAQRRSALRAHCALQREELARNADNIESRLGSVDNGINAVRNLATRPLVLFGGAALLALFGPKRMMRWVGRGAVFLTTGRRLWRLFH